MAEIGKWLEHTFEVSPSVIRGFTGLTLKGSSDTEDKTKNKQNYVTRKNGKPREMSFTVHLDKRLGCDVETEANTFLQEACDGAKDYFYIGGKKLIADMVMLTDASVDQIGMAGSAMTWVCADVKLTFKQCESTAAKSGGGSSGGGGSKKTSSKSGSTTKSKSGSSGSSSKQTTQTLSYSSTSIFTATSTENQKTALTTVNKVSQAAKKVTEASKTTKKVDALVKTGKVVR